MTGMQERAGLRVADALAEFIERDVLPPLNMAPDTFWRGLADVFASFAPENRALLAERDGMQAEIDAWHRERRGREVGWSEYRAFLERIGYLAPEPASVRVSSANV